MRVPNRLAFLPFVSLLLCAAAVEPVLDKADFTVQTFEAPHPNYIFSISVKKPLDDETAKAFCDRANWTVYAARVEGDKQERLPSASPGSCQANGNSHFTFEIPKSSLGGQLPDGVALEVTAVFLQPGSGRPPFLATLSLAQPGTGKVTLKPVVIKLDSDGRRDPDTKADVVISGALVSASGAKPTYFFESQLKYRFGQSGFDVNGKIVGNEGSAVDPDSIKAALGYKKHLPRWNGRGLFWRTWLLADALRGEFSRKDQTSNIGASVMLESLSVPWTFNSAKTRFAFLQLRAGAEAARNLNKPDSIPALREYKGAFRPTLGATIDLTLDSVAYPDGEARVPRFTVTADYLARIPTTREPFTRLVGEERVYSLSRQTRHSVETTVLWQAANYWGVFSKYRYGTLPPLFILTDHQVLFGFAFQGRWK